jgi:hypothetical protein
MMCNKLALRLIEKHADNFCDGLRSERLALILVTSEAGPDRRIGW